MSIFDRFVKSRNEISTPTNVSSMGSDDPLEEIAEAKELQARLAAEKAARDERIIGSFEQQLGFDPSPDDPSLQAKKFIEYVADGGPVVDADNLVRSVLRVPEGPIDTLEMLFHKSLKVLKKDIFDPAVDTVQTAFKGDKNPEVSSLDKLNNGLENVVAHNGKPSKGTTFVG